MPDPFSSVYVVTALISGPPTTAAATEPNEKPRVEFVLSEALLPDVMETRLRNSMEPRINSLIEELARDIADADAWTLRTEIVGHPFTYSWSVVVVRGDNTPDTTRITCQCDTKALVDTVEEAMWVALNAAREDAMKAPEPAPTASALETAAEPPPQARPSEPTPSPQAPTRANTTTPRNDSAPARGGFGALGITGAVIAAGGATMLTVGAVRWGLGEETDTLDQESVVRRYHSPGTDAMTIVGGVALAAGITMVFVDLFVCRTRPRGCRKPVARALLRGASGHF